VLAVVLIPALVIQPFRPQSTRGLEISFALKRIAPLFTIAPLVDATTASEWDFIGRAIAGPLADRQL